MRICGGTACGAPAGAPHFWQKLLPGGRPAPQPVQNPTACGAPAGAPHAWQNLLPGGRPAPQPVQNPIRQPSILPGKETVNDDTWAFAVNGSTCVGVEFGCKINGCAIFGCWEAERTELASS